MKDFYYVICFPVKHRLSPAIQMRLEQQYNQDMLFTDIEVEPQDLEAKIKEFKTNTQVKGLIVTVPN
ncbi:shikimate dehydrogenase, partial [Francisella tularensis subsp. holarctica]|nr:shikimate dehydrogenase [Francisella tularensis subsp. holarctica]